MHPYGSSAYRSAPSASEVTARRYRYTGKERDEETGLDYFGARYYAPWLGRWTSADPLGIEADGPGLYNYVRASPVVLHDPNGNESFRELVARLLPGRKAVPEARSGLRSAFEGQVEKVAPRPRSEIKRPQRPERPGGTLVVGTYQTTEKGQVTTKMAEEREFFLNAAKGLASKVPGATAASVGSGKELLSELEKETGRSGSVRNLAIYSHSGKGGISMRWNQGFFRSDTPMPGFQITPEEREAGARNVEDLKRAIESGKIKFAKDARIIILGCNCGESDAAVAAVITRETGVTTIAAKGSAWPAEAVESREASGGWWRFTRNQDGTVKESQIEKSVIDPKLHLNLPDKKK